jgi:hypothetical protein
MARFESYLAAQTDRAAQRRVGRLFAELACGAAAVLIAVLFVERLAVVRVGAIGAPPAWALDDPALDGLEQIVPPPTHGGLQDRVIASPHGHAPVRRS